MSTIILTAALQVSIKPLAVTSVKPSGARRSLRTRLPPACSPIIVFIHNLFITQGAEEQCNWDAHRM